MSSHFFSSPLIFQANKPLEAIAESGRGVMMDDAINALAATTTTAPTTATSVTSS